MISKILVANRGEIALRVVRSARELGFKTVAVFSEPDRQSLHALLADERVCIGPAKASESYLNIANILSAAEITGADAIHPGYGFLAENAKFAEICENAGLTFIGPPPSLIRLMGDKNKARQTMKKAGLPVLPGSEKGVEDANEAKKIAAKIGFPVILKAAAGGGGKGMRICRSSVQLEEQFPIAQGEAKAAFGDSSLYIEKFLSGARHIEIQVIGDKKGKVIAFGERECSIQRKYQKLVEETPSPFIDEKTRRRMIKEAEDAAAEVGYQSLGTFEFLVDEKERFYFMEANARVQVEHPITEMVYGINLIKAQIRIAAGEKVNFPYEPRDARACHRMPDQRRGPQRRSSPRRGRSISWSCRGARGSAWIPRPTAAGSSPPITIPWWPRSSPSLRPGIWPSGRCRWPSRRRPSSASRRTSPFTSMSSPTPTSARESTTPSSWKASWTGWTQKRSPDGEREAPRPGRAHFLRREMRTVNSPPLSLMTSSLTPR